MKVSIIPWIIKKLKSCLALVEDGNTATQNIAKGKYVIWKGVMCRAASAISSGDTLSGTNLPAVSGGAVNEVSALVDGIVTDMNSMRMYKDNSNLTEYTVTIPDYAEITAKYCLLIGYNGVYYVYVNADGIGAGMTALWTTIGTYSITRNSKTSLTFTFSSTQWGGIRLLWLE